MDLGQIAPCAVAAPPHADAKWDAQLLGRVLLPGQAGQHNMHPGLVGRLSGRHAVPHRVGQRELGLVLSVGAMHRHFEAEVERPPLAACQLQLLLARQTRPGLDGQV